VGGSVQQRFSYSHTLSFADQAALPGGDTIGFAEAKTFWGTQGGVDVRIRNGWMVGAKGFYTASSDTSIAGGTAYLRIPFSYASR